MIAIACADKNWGIGNKGKLLASIPADMKFFRAATTGHTVVMGRKTLESLPGGRPLRDRRNIVLTRNQTFSCDGAEVVHSVEELLSLLSDHGAYPERDAGLPESEDRVYVIGGGSIYRELLTHCREAYITRIDYSYEADTFFPDLDSDPEWKLLAEGEEETYYDLIYHFNKYERALGFKG